MTASAYKRNPFAIIVLAAGLSSRMGQPKQLLPYKGTTLLEYNILQAAKSSASQVVTVLGANARNIQDRCKLSGTEIILNKNFERGIGTSIRSGVEWAITYPQLEGLVITLADVLNIESRDYDQLFTNYQNQGNPNVVRTRYMDTYGPPVFFKKNCFSALLNISDKQGARSVINMHKSHISDYQIARPFLDADTPEDLKTAPK